MNGWLPVIAGTGSAVAAGFYLAFSAVAMPALQTRPGKEAIAAMISINDKAVQPPFMVLFFGTAAACGAVAAAAAVGGATDPLIQSPIRAAGAAAYLAGWASTMLVNVPLNNSLTKDGSTRADRQWDTYRRSWSWANHVRCALSIAGAVGLLIPVHHTAS